MCCSVDQLALSGTTKLKYGRTIPITCSASPVSDHFLKPEATVFDTMKMLPTEEESRVPIYFLEMKHGMEADHVLNLETTLIC